MLRWYQAWRDGGTEALRSNGPVSREKLSPQQWARPELELRKGPLAYGFAWDCRWTLGRIKALIVRLFRVGCTAEGVETDAPTRPVLPGSRPLGARARRRGRRGILETPAKGESSRRPTCQRRGGHENGPDLTGLRAVFS